jgi:hypothetical protein
MNKSLFLLALSTASCAFSKAPAPVATIKCQDPNPTSRWQTEKNSNLYLAGDFLWMQPLNETLVYLKHNSETMSHNRYYQNVFRPAVRVTLGYNSDYDGWDLYLNYTAFRYKHNNSILVFYFDPENYQGSYYYKLNYNLATLDLGRMYKISKKFSLRPHAGLKGMWISQTGKMSYANILQNLTGLYDKRTFDGNLFGVQLGADSFLNIYKKLSAYGKLCISGLINSQTFVSDYYGSDLPIRAPIYSYLKTDHGYRLINGFDLALGLTWNTQLSNDRFHLGINLGYEMSNYVNMINGSNIMGGTMWDMLSNDFTLQAWSLGLRLDF